MRLLFLLLLTGFSCSLGRERISYHGYKMYKAKPTTDEQMEYLMKIQNDFPMERMHVENLDFIVAPEEQNRFEKYMKELQIEIEVSIEDIGE